MRKLLLTSIALFFYAVGFSQTAVGKRKTFSIGVQYNHEFVLDGYVRVREWEVEGDKMKLKELGMTSYPVLRLTAEKYFKRNNSLSVTYDNYYMRGTAVFTRDIAYNGTIINGTKGIDVSPTRYFRVSAIYKSLLLRKPQFDLNYTVALVLDYITFYLDGEVSPVSTSNEVFERFGRQALPYPVLGLQGKAAMGKYNYLNVEVSGTYIPRFKSFYTERGHVYLDYSNFLADLSYSRTISAFELAIGANLRYMHLFQESPEDTNIINTFTAGPYIGIDYHF